MRRLACWPLAPLAAAVVLAGFLAGCAGDPAAAPGPGDGPQEPLPVGGVVYGRVTDSAGQPPSAGAQVSVTILKSDCITGGGGIGGGEPIFTEDDGSYRGTLVAGGVAPFVACLRVKATGFGVPGQNVATVTGAVLNLVERSDSATLDSVHVDVTLPLP